MCYFIFGNVSLFCRHFRDIRSRNVDDHDLENWLRSNLNMLIEIPYATSYLMAIVMFALSITILETFTVEICMTLTSTIRIDKSQIYNF